MCLCRSDKARVQFNTHAFALEWSDCMATCSKYRRAMAPIFTTQEELEELITWAYKTTTDPTTGNYYPDTLGRSFWIPARLFISKITSFNIQLSFEVFPLS